MSGRDRDHREADVHPLGEDLHVEGQRGRDQHEEEQPDRRLLLENPGRCRVCQWKRDAKVIS